MGQKMSLKSRQELLLNIRDKYQDASWEEKTKILESFITVTGYQRKHAIYLLNKKAKKVNCKKLHSSVQYDQMTCDALIFIWHAANKICSKRLVPFLPVLITALEKHGHLILTTNVRNKLLSISTATVDRLLKPIRLDQKKKGTRTTRGASLLKKKIKVRTFSDCSEVVPGFFEADLVAHCGTSMGGSFLNTLVLTDIVSAWTEFMPLLCKGEANVIEALKIAQKIVPFTFLGLDTDNGSEFINNSLFEFCEEEKIFLLALVLIKKTIEHMLKKKMDLSYVV